MTTKLDNYEELVSLVKEMFQVLKAEGIILDRILARMEDLVADKYPRINNN